MILWGAQRARDTRLPSPLLLLSEADRIQRFFVLPGDVEVGPLQREGGALARFSLEGRYARHLILISFFALWRATSFRDCRITRFGLS